MPTYIVEEVVTMQVEAPDADAALAHVAKSEAPLTVMSRETTNVQEWRA